MALCLAQKPLTKAERAKILLQEHDWIEVACALQGPYTAHQCREQWGSQKFMAKKHPFSKSELASLAATVGKHNGRNWTEICVEHSSFGFVRTAIQLFKACKTLLPREPKPWTNDEIENLSTWIKYYKSRGIRDIYFSAATRLPGRNLEQVRTKYLALQSEKRGRWTTEEDEQLQRGMKEHGEKWMMVAKYVPTRTGIQCREHWTAGSNPEIKKGLFSLLEIRNLAECVCQYGEKWAFIAQGVYLPGRSDGQVIL